LYSTVMAQPHPSGLCLDELAASYQKVKECGKAVARYMQLIGTSTPFASPG